MELVHWLINPTDTLQLPVCQPKRWLELSADGARCSRPSWPGGTQTGGCTRASSHTHTAEDTAQRHLQDITRTTLTFIFTRRSSGIRTASSFIYFLPWVAHADDVTRAKRRIRNTAYTVTVHCGGAEWTRRWKCGDIFVQKVRGRRVASTAGWKHTGSDDINL